MEEKKKKKNLLLNYFPEPREIAGFCFQDPKEELINLFPSPQALLLQSSPNILQKHKKPDRQLDKRTGWKFHTVLV